MEKVESTLEEIGTTQSTLTSVVEKIQNYVMQDADQDETTSVDKTPTTSSRIPLLARLSKELVVLSRPTRRSFWENLEKQLHLLSERYPKEPLIEPKIETRGPEVILTEPIISRARAPPLEEPVHR